MKPQSTPIDLETLLAPISEGAPSGASLRYEGTYDKIREARREDDASLPMGDWETKLKIADFSVVDKLCQEALQKKSKDLQIAAWLVEAWVVRQRIRGLAHGLSLVAALAERFWGSLFPELGEDGDPTSRVGIVEWLDEVLADRARRASFSDVGEGAAFSLFDWERAGQTASSEAAAEEGAPKLTRESLIARVSLGGASPWSALLRDVEGAKTASGAVERVFAERLSEQPPSLRRLRDVLLQIEGLARDGARLTGELVTAAEEPSSGEAGGGTPETLGFVAGGGGGQGPITSRAEAYFRLAEAAEYLMRAEPHSPVPYLVKRAVQWGNMSLAELLYELVGTPDDIVTIQRLLGMRGREE